MSVYFKKGKGWRYDFTLKGTRYTMAWYKTKREAQKAESQRREDMEQTGMTTETPIDTSFLTLANKRLDYIKAYHSKKHYQDHVYLARRWVREWDGLDCSQISRQMIESYLTKQKRKTSAISANKELRYLRSLFNWGLDPGRELISNNPTKGIKFMPEEERTRYVPPKQDVLRVIMAADPETQDYLWTIALTMGRVGEINRLKWEDVNLNDRYVILFTRKKKGGHRRARKIPMSQRLYEILSRRHLMRDRSMPWVFWHRRWDRFKGEWTEGPYVDRKSFMRTLCRKAGVRYFRFHALRHFGASMLDQANVPIGSIQRILGHENRTTTEIYLHSIGESEREAVGILDRLSENPHTDSHTEIKKDLTEIS